MKRWPLIASFLLFIVLCASAAYWAMQLFKPPVRPVAAPPRVAKADVNTGAAGALFGGRAGKVAVASNYQLRGVIFSGSPHDSVAIVSADGKQTQAIRADTELMPGVTVKEVHRDYVLLSENGVVKRVELPENANDVTNPATAAPGLPATRAVNQEPRAPRVSKSGPPNAPAARIAPAMPPTVVQPSQPQQQSQSQPQPQSQPQLEAPANSAQAPGAQPPPLNTTGAPRTGVPTQ